MKNSLKRVAIVLLILGASYAARINGIEKGQAVGYWQGHYAGQMEEIAQEKIDHPKDFAAINGESAEVQ